MKRRFNPLLLLLLLPLVVFGYLMYRNALQCPAPWVETLSEITSNPAAVKGEEIPSALASRGMMGWNYKSNISWLFQATFEQNRDHMGQWVLALVDLSIYVRPERFGPSGSVVKIAEEGPEDVPLAGATWSHTWYEITDGPFKDEYLVVRKTMKAGVESTTFMVESAPFACSKKPVAGGQPGPTAVCSRGKYRDPDDYPTATVASAAPAPPQLPPLEQPTCDTTKLPKGEVRMGATTVNGRLDPEEIQRVVRASYDRFLGCYDVGRCKDPKLQGRVAVRFVIGTDGTVSNVGNGGSDLPDPGVVQCVVRTYGGMTFPRPEGGVVTVVYPIMFSPKK
jgi:hypothetical protein